MNKYSALGLVSAVTVGLATFAGSGLASGVAASGTTHSVTAASKSNFSSAVERPTWSFSCDSAAKTWTFAINNVQVIDSSGKPWYQNNSNTGPWRIGFWAAAKAGLIPFSREVKLSQNTTNGLFTAKASSTAANAATWCKTGAGVSVTAFSGANFDDQVLLLDGVLS